MNLSKRQFLSLSAATVVATTLGVSVTDVLAATDETEKRISDFAGGKKPGSRQGLADDAGDR